VPRKGAAPRPDLFAEAVAEARAKAQPGDVLTTAVYCHNPRCANRYVYLPVESWERPTSRCPGCHKANVELRWIDAHHGQTPWFALWRGSLRRRGVGRPWAMIAHAGSARA